MLAAERAALTHEVNHDALNIRERELNINLNFMNNIGTMAALLGGFAFSLIAGVPEDVNVWLEAIHLGLGVLSFGCSMYCVLVSTQCSHLAPRKAFKDSQNSAVAFAIHEMDIDCKRVSRVFARLQDSNPGLPRT
jgi:hypothetical protein